MRHNYRRLVRRKWVFTFRRRQKSVVGKTSNKISVDVFPAWSYSLLFCSHSYLSMLISWCSSLTYTLLWFPELVIRAIHKCPPSPPEHMVGTYVSTQLVSANEMWSKVACVTSRQNASEPASAGQPTACETAAALPAWVPSDRDEQKSYQPVMGIR